MQTSALVSLVLILPRFNSVNRYPHIKKLEPYQLLARNNINFINICGCSSSPYFFSSSDNDPTFSKSSRNRNGKLSCFIAVFQGSSCCLYNIIHEIYSKPYNKLKPLWVNGQTFLSYQNLSTISGKEFIFFQNIHRKQILFLSSRQNGRQHLSLRRGSFILKISSLNLHRCKKVSEIDYNTVN